MGRTAAGFVRALVKFRIICQISYGYRSGFRVFLLTVHGFDIRDPGCAGPAALCRATEPSPFSPQGVGGLGASGRSVASWPPSCARPAGPARKSPPLPSIYGDGHSLCRSVGQSSGLAFRLELETRTGLAAQGSALRSLLDRFVGAYLGQISQTGACNRLHALEQRLCRWLLMAHDRIG